MSKENILKFRTIEQAVLFENEISGQISDGHWENSRPMNHWKNWCEAKVVVDANEQGRNFYTSRSYNLLNPELLNVVGQRMIVYVKLAHAFGPENVKLLEHLFGFLATAVYESFGFQGMPTYEGKYWDEVRTKLAAFDPLAVAVAVANDPYDMKSLRTDLREMTTAMRTELR